MVVIRFFSLRSISFLSLVTAFSQSLSAAEAPVLEEILVTTQKREQLLMEVPVTVTGYTGNFLNSLGINEFDELSDITPGLVVQEQSANNPAFVIRGITSDDGAAQISPRVSVYFNGADVSRPQGSLFELYDIEQVEVARGPQATIFGTAAAIGAVSVSSRRAEPDFDAAINVGFGNYDSIETSGFINGGSEQLAARLAFSVRQRDGYSRNIAGEPGSQSQLDQPDLNGLDRQALRGSLHFGPTDNLIFDLIVNYEEDRDPGTGFKSGLIAPSGGSTDPLTYLEIGNAGPLAETALGNDTIGVRRDIYDVNLSGTWLMSQNWSASFVSDYREFDNIEVFDADGSQALLLQFADDAEGEQWSQELRFNYSDERLNAIFGINFFHEEGRQHARFLTDEGVFLNCAAMVVPGLPCTNPDGSVNSVTALQGLPDIYYSGRLSNSGDNDSRSLFADVTFHLNPQWDLTAGVRYVREDKQSGASVILPDSVLTGGPLLPAAVNSDGVWVYDEADFDAVLPRINVLFRASPALHYYGSISKGRRSPVIDVDTALDAGGNLVAGTQLIPEEKIINYEAGIKSRLWDERLRLNAALFYQDYSNFQVTIFDENAQAKPSNAGSATNSGVEVETRALLSDELELFSTLAYIDAKVDDTPANGIFAGNRFRLQPRWTASLGAEYARFLSGGLEFFVRPVWSFRSDVFFQVPNDPVSGLAVSEGDVSQLNLRAGISGNDRQWSVTGFVTNAFDKEYIIDAGNLGAVFGSPTFIAGPPRFYGLELSYRL